MIGDYERLEAQLDAYRRAYQQLDEAVRDHERGAQRLLSGRDARLHADREHIERVVKRENQ